MDRGNLVYAGYSMAHFQMLQDSDPAVLAGASVPMQDNNAGQVARPAPITPGLAAPKDAALDMKFQTYKEFHASECNLYSVVPITDPTYPRTDQEDLQWVRAVLYNMINMDGIQDGEKMQKQWRNIMEDKMERIESVAWCLVRQVKRYQGITGRLDPSNPDNRKASKIRGFANHMNRLLPHLRTTKTLCRHLTGYCFINTFIDGPEQSMVRIGANRRVNNTKKAKSVRGAAAAAKVEELLGVSLGDEEVAEYTQQNKRRHGGNQRARAAPAARRSRNRSNTADDEESEESLEDDEFDIGSSGNSISPTSLTSNKKVKTRSSPTPAQTRYSLRGRSGNPTTTSEATMYNAAPAQTANYTSAGPTNSPTPGSMSCTDAKDMAMPAPQKASMPTTPIYSGLSYHGMPMTPPTMGYHYMRSTSTPSHHMHSPVASGFFPSSYPSYHWPIAPSPSITSNPFGRFAQNQWLSDEDAKIPPPGTSAGAETDIDAYGEDDPDFNPAQTDDSTYGSDPLSATASHSYFPDVAGGAISGDFNKSDFAKSDADGFYRDVKNDFTAASFNNY